jgi:hypothetical protein
MRKWWVAAALALAAACGSSGGDDGDGAGGAGSGEPSGAGAGSGSGGDGIGGGFTTGSGASSNGSGGSAEVCDGKDNDNNGVADDIDAGGDGICDCLRIATLGQPGEWGVGDVFATWLDERSDNGAVSLGDQVLTAALLEEYQVIVAENVSTLARTYAPEEVAALDAWVQGGGGFMTLIGYGDPSERTNANTLLAPFGITYLEQQILQKTGGSTVPVTGWQPHPVSMGVTRIGVDNGYPVSGGGTLVASEQGFDMLRAVEVGAGHVLAWGDEWITYDSEWTDHPDYQVELFWLNAIKWLTPAKECQVPVPEPK